MLLQGFVRDIQVDRYQDYTMPIKWKGVDAIFTLRIPENAERFDDCGVKIEYGSFSMLCKDVIFKKEVMI